MPERQVAGPEDPATTETIAITRSHLSVGEPSPIAVEEDLKCFFESLYGDSNGYLHMTYAAQPYLAADGKVKHRVWSERLGERYPFEYPGQVDDAIRAILDFSARGVDVYVSTSLLSSRTSRTENKVVALWCLHADCDTEDLDLDEIAAQGWCVVGSGSPGHYHVYIPLSEPVTPAQFRVLQDALVVLLEADPKKAGNDVLRPPGTRNCKDTVRPGGESRPVEWVVTPTGQRIDPRVLAKMLGVDLDRPRPSTLAATTNGQVHGGRAETEEFDLDSYPSVQAALARITDDRSADTHALVGACCRANLTFPQACWAVYQSDRLASRLHERREADEADLLRCWLRVVDDRQREAQGRENADEEKPLVHLRDRLLTLTNLENLVPPKPLISGLIYQNTAAQISGPPGSYKSFIAVGMMCSLATGTPFSDFEVPRRGKTVYVAAEGASGIRKRLLAWCEQYKVDPEELNENLLILPIPLQLDDRDQIAQMIDIVGEFRADMLVLDTRARCTVGLEENSATAQGKAIEALDRIRDGTGCTPLGVHHSSRTGTAGRGSNAWDGAVWSDLRVNGSHQVAKLHCEKHKDIPDGCDHHFAFLSRTVPEKLMPGISLQDRSTLVLSRIGSGFSGPTANSRQVILDIIRTTAPVDGFTPTQIVEFASEYKIARATAYGALKWLVDRGRIENVGSDKRARYVADTQSDDPEKV